MNLNFYLNFPTSYPPFQHRKHTMRRQKGATLKEEPKNVPVLAAKLDMRADAGTWTDSVCEDKLFWGS